MKENVIPFEVQINKLFARKDFQESIEKNYLLDKRFLLVGLYSHITTSENEDGDVSGYKVYVNNLEDLGNNWFVANGDPESGFHELRRHPEAHRFILTRTYYLVKDKDGKVVPEFLFNDKEALNQKIMKSVLREIAWKKHLRPGNFLSRKQMHIKGALFPEAVLAMSALDEDTGIRYWLASCFDNGRLSVTPEDECEILKEYDNTETVMDTPFSRYVASAADENGQNVVWKRDEVENDSFILK
jgi:hypothetical protein